MADNVAITAGSGTTIGTDERSIGGTSVHLQRMSPIGGSAIVSGHVTVSSTAGNIVAAAETRHCLTIVNYQTVPVYVGPATVTTSSGFRLDPGASLTLHVTSAVQGITAAAYTAAGEDDKVHYVEETSA